MKQSKLTNSLAASPQHPQSGQQFSDHDDDLAALSKLLDGAAIAWDETNCLSITLESGQTLSLGVNWGAEEIVLYLYSGLQFKPPFSAKQRQCELLGCLEAVPCAIWRVEWQRRGKNRSIRWLICNPNGTLYRHPDIESSYRTKKAAFAAYWQLAEQCNANQS